MIDFNKTMEAEVKNSEYSDYKLVYGEGPVNAKILLIGEAPGGEEEKQGRPFVGSAGKNLNEFLETIGLEREELYITNTVKFRPVKMSPKTGKPVNRTPVKKEIEFFKVFLFQEIALINPEYVVTLGNTALKAVAGESYSIGQCHGQATVLDGFQLFPLYHPASIIYNRALKDTYKEDILKLKSLLV